MATKSIEEHEAGLTWVMDDGMVAPVTAMSAPPSRRFRMVTSIDELQSDLGEGMEQESKGPLPQEKLSLTCSRIGADRREQTLDDHFKLAQRVLGRRAEVYGNAGKGEVGANGVEQVAGAAGA